MKNVRVTACVGLLLVPFLLGSRAKSETAPSPFPKSVSEIPLEKCSPTEALSVSYFATIARQGADAKQSLHVDEEMQKLSASLPKSNLPVSKLMTPDQVAEFERLRMAMIIQSMNQLAESRLERDDLAMQYAVEAIHGILAGAKTLTTKQDPQGEGAGLIGVLTKALAKDGKIPMQEPDQNVCSIDLAFEKQERASMARLAKLMRSQEFRMLLALRAKYKVIGLLNPQKLPSPDREEAIWLTKAVGVPIQRQVMAMESWQNLRWYAKASRLEYRSLRNDIVIGGGSIKYLGTSIRKAFASASQATKDAIIAWRVMEKAVPSEQQKLMSQIGKFPTSASGQQSK